MIKMNKDAKLGDSFYNEKDGKWYYYDGLNWVLPLIFSYKNYKGTTSERTVLPSGVFYGITEYHKQPQYFLHAWDIEKKAYRDFALQDIQKFL